MVLVASAATIMVPAATSNAVETRDGHTTAAVTDSQNSQAPNIINHTRLEITNSFNKPVWLTARYGSNTTTKHAEGVFYPGRTLTYEGSFNAMADVSIRLYELREDGSHDQCLGVFTGSNPGVGTPYIGMVDTTLSFDSQTTDYKLDEHQKKSDVSPETNSQIKADLSRTANTYGAGTQEGGVTLPGGFNNLHLNIKSMPSADNYLPIKMVNETDPNYLMQMVPTDGTSDSYEVAGGQSADIKLSEPSSKKRTFQVRVATQGPDNVRKYTELRDFTVKYVPGKALPFGTELWFGDTHLPMKPGQSWTIKLEGFSVVVDRVSDDHGRASYEFHLKQN